MPSLKICTRCIYDGATPGISFDQEGVCNFCRQIESMLHQYKTGSPEGEQALQEIVAQIKKSRPRGRYDCVVGVSGGTDSSYLLYLAKQWGLRPLAVHYDNTWNAAVATANIRKVTAALDVDLYTHVVRHREADDIFRAFLLAGVPEFDASTDIGFAQVLRQAAARHGIKYILEGHSFQAEGISPMSRNYFDGKYIASVHSKYGKIPLKTYPNMTFFQFMKWLFVYRQKFIRPLWYINYSKREAKTFLMKEFGWKDYGGHHLENRSAAYLHKVYNPKKFGIDNRSWSLSASVRTREMSRAEALEIMAKPIEPDADLEAFVKKRLGLSEADYEKIFNGPVRSFRDFKTYKRRFERLRPLFYLAAKHNLVPMSFYLKYCFPLADRL